MDNKNKKAYFVGGGLASFAGAAYLIKDGDFDGKNINILESLNILGGSNDGIGTNEGGFVCRGGRMLNEETYENFWDLFKGIPSLHNPEMSVTEEILAFDEEHPTHANARLIDKDGQIQNAHKMGFSSKDKKELVKLLMTSEDKLDNIRINEWFNEHFFTTNFWYMWQTTFAFQKWSSVFELRRYMNRMIFEFSRIDTLEGVTRTRYDQYDSVILPLKKYLEDKGVIFSLNHDVVDLEFKDGNKITVSDICYNKNGETKKIHLNDGDICIITNGCMTDNSSLGDFKTAPKLIQAKAKSQILWENITKKKLGLGNPKPFFDEDNIDESKWESFTVTMKGNKLLKLIEEYSSNIPGNGALMTFKDSSWLMSIVVAAQPHFINQDADTTIFWGYGLYTNAIGDYVKKPMKECTGEELLIELLHHLHFEKEIDEILSTVVNVIPCMMPYIVSQFQPRMKEDRPLPVPEVSTNLGFASQYVEIADDMVFTEEYSVRAARTAVYTLLGIDKEIIPVTPYNKKPSVILKAIEASFR